MNRLRKIGIPTLSTCFVLCAAAAFAQTKTVQAGPLVLQPTGDGPVLAPEVKIAWLQQNTGTLIGGYGGWMADNRMLFAWSLDVLVDHGYHDPVADLWYTGFLGGWATPANRAVQAGVRGLVGFGEATVTDNFTHTVPPNPHPFRDMTNNPPGSVTYVQQAHFHDGFFIFEPQGTVALHVSRFMAIDIAGGYRVISGLGHYNSWVQGASATIGVRFGPPI
jgi:hypothetical protein